LNNTNSSVQPPLSVTPCDPLTQIRVALVDTDDGCRLFDFLPDTSNPSNFNICTISIRQLSTFFLLRSFILHRFYSLSYVLYIYTLLSSFSSLFFFFLSLYIPTWTSSACVVSASPPRTTKVLRTSPAFLLILLTPSFQLGMIQCY